MEVLVSTAAASAPLSSARVHRRPLTRSVAFCAPARRGWRCRSAALTRPDPVPSEEPASGSAATTTTVVTDEPDAPAGEEKSGEASGGSSGFFEVTVEDEPVSPPEEPEEGGGVDEVLGKLGIQVTPTYVVLGGGALIALLIISKIISAIDSVPLLPNVLELVGTGYSIWFTTRYLLFKESRDELFAKFEDLRDMII